MTFMVIEKFHPGKQTILYRRFYENGRMLPDEVTFIDSWVSSDVSICYQLMEADSLAKLEEWITHWKDLADFEIIPVVSSKEARAKILG